MARRRRPPTARGPPEPMNGSMTINLECSPSAAEALERIRLALESAAPSPEFVDRVTDAFDGGAELFCALDADGLSAAGAARTVLHPTELLLELASAAGTGERDLRIKHGEAP